MTNKKENNATNCEVTREQMIELLNEDLAGEYQAIIAYIVYSQTLKGAAYTDIARELEAHAAEELSHAIKISKQIDYFGGMPCVQQKPVKVSSDPVVMLRADLQNERETVGRYRQRIRQAEAMGEFALSETLRQIIVQEQEHEIDLSAALNIDVPPAIAPAESNGRRQAPDAPLASRESQPQAIGKRRN
jgi:bacterioferritin